MRILLIAMTDSVHTARWVSQIADQGWDIHLFPSIDSGILHPELRGVTAHVPLYGKRPDDRSLRIKGITVVSDFIANGLSLAVSKADFYREHKVKRLVNVIGKVKPDIVHALEMQNAGYLALEAKKRFSGKFPPLITTNWGSDIYLFGRLPEHKERIKDLLGMSDYYSCECRRDVGLAEKFGYKGVVLPVFPNAGGFDLEKASSLRRPGPVSERRLIMLKGYQHWAGRALVGLRALERCADILKGYSIAIYSFSQDTEIAAALFQESTGIPVKIVSKNTPHHDILRLHGEARISIGLSISDGISTSFLEALVMGSFPVQSWTACADEWIRDGETGLLVPPEDPDIIEKALRRALTDDDLVNMAAEKNWKTALERLDHSILKPKAVEFYNKVAEERGVRKWKR